MTSPVNGNRDVSLLHSEEYIAFFFAQNGQPNLKKFTTPLDKCLKVWYDISGGMMIPDNALEIMNQLNSNGFQAYVVGGAPRDIILGKNPSDFDIATDARPEQVETIFNERVQSTDNSRAHGTVFVNGVDVTTFRTDHDEDGASARVEFAKSFLDDASRRDFTFNGMAMDGDGNIIDPFGGREDLRGGIVRAIGDPEQRVQESYVRMLRACRFMALDTKMRMDEDLHVAIVHNAHLMSFVPVELIQRELMKMMSYPAPTNGMEALRSTGLLGLVLPEFVPTINCTQECPRHTYDVFFHCVSVMQHLPADRPLLRLAGLLHDIGKPECKSFDADGQAHFYNHEYVGVELAAELMWRLRFSNQEISYVTTLIREHMYTAITPRAIRRLLVRLGDVPVEDLFMLRAADRFANDGQAKRESRSLAMTRRIVKEIREQQQALRVADLAIGGDNLIAAGYAPGPMFGHVLNQLLEEVLDEPSKNNGEYLMVRARELFG